MNVEFFKNELKNSLVNAFTKAFPNAEKLDFSLEIPPEEQNSDFACPFFIFSKQLKTSPNQIASKILENLEKPIFLEEVLQAGAYLNFKIKTESLAKTVLTQVLTEKENYGSSDFGNKKKVLIEYSSPTTNKPLHLGHVRNNLIGISVIRILKMAGYDVKTICLYNDRGIQICKSMLAYQKFCQNENPKTLGIKPDHYVGDLYVRFSKEEKENPTLTKEVQEMLQKWEADDKETIELWQKMSNWVYEGYNQTYKRMGVTFDYRQYESETYLLGKKISYEALEKGIFFQKEDGSVWIDLTNEGLDEKLVVRGDGTSVYITQDFGNAVERQKNIGFEKMVYVVGNEQDYHFQALFKILKKLGYAWADECFHLSYGMVELPTGKMKSREGTVVDADLLMDEVKELVKEGMQKTEKFSETELDQTAEIISLGAISFFILKVHPNKRILFNPQESIDFQGMTGTYVQYSHTRIVSILRKFGENLPQEADFSLLTEAEEIALLRTLANFSQTVKEAAIGFNPSKIANYSYTLAKNFSKFYDKHSVLNLENEELKFARIVLLEAVKITLKNSLNLLGIKAPEKM
ncbi:arginine--tRNA ligase [bacterium]|nr:arginine--tRNA ligase [bacterium]